MSAARSLLTVPCSETFVIRNTFLELTDDADREKESRRRSVSDYCDRRRSRTLTTGSIKGLEAVLEGDSDDTDTPDEEEFDRSHSLTDESLVFGSNLDVEETMQLDRPHSFTDESLCFGSTSSTIFWGGLCDESFEAHAEVSQCHTQSPDMSEQAYYGMSYDNAGIDNTSQEAMQAPGGLVWVAVPASADEQTSVVDSAATPQTSVQPFALDYPAQVNNCQGFIPFVPQAMPAEGYAPPSLMPAYGNQGNCAPQIWQAPMAWCVYTTPPVPPTTAMMCQPMMPTQTPPELESPRSIHEIESYSSAELSEVENSPGESVQLLEVAPSPVECVAEEQAEVTVQVTKKKRRRGNRHGVWQTNVEEAESEPTTVMLRNLPNRYTRKMLLRLLDSHGFAGDYDFVYLPMDFRHKVNLGYAFVNISRHDAAARLKDCLDGFSSWAFDSHKVCEAVWASPHQGLEQNVERYRNSPVMHESVTDDFRPLLFKDGIRVDFPPPTRSIRAPKIRPDACHASSSDHA